MSSDGLAKDMMQKGKDFIVAEEKDLRKLKDFNDKLQYPNINDQTPIYRYVSSKTFLSMIECCTRFNSDSVEGENWLSHISRWEDPFEGFVFRGRSSVEEVLNNKENQYSVRNQYQNYFGQSWTLCEKESDLRWRAYCPNGDGVRIESTVGRLKKDIMQHSRNLVESACLFSRVFYCEKEILKNKMKLKGKSKLNYGLGMLFIKSLEFADEFEYRVIVDASLLREAIMGKKRKESNFRVENGFLKYNLKRSGDSGKFALFENILLDPRMSNMDVERLKSCISQTGLKCTVKRSVVYDWFDA